MVATVATVSSLAAMENYSFRTTKPFLIIFTDTGLWFRALIFMKGTAFKNHPT